jgi:hypothetical protein
MSLARKLVDIAHGEVGTLEQGGNNNGPRIRTYQGATNLNPGSWPWCAAFTAWVLRAWLSAADVREALKLPDKAAAERWRCKYAGAFRWEEWARARGVQILPETATCRAGDFVLFDFSHIGIVSIGGKSGQSIETIEGNTGPAGLRDSNSGDGVWIKEREHSPRLIRSFIRVI